MLNDFHVYHGWLTALVDDNDAIAAVISYEKLWGEIPKNWVEIYIGILICITALTYTISLTNFVSIYFHIIMYHMLYVYTNIIKQD